MSKNTSTIAWLVSCAVYKVILSCFVLTLALFGGTKMILKAPDYADNIKNTLAKVYGVDESISKLSDALKMAEENLENETDENKKMQLQAEYADARAALKAAEKLKQDTNSWWKKFRLVIKEFG